MERIEYFGKREKEEEKENKFKEIEHTNEILDPTNNHSLQNPTDYMWKLVGETRKDVENERKTETRMFYGKYNARGVQTKFSSRGLSQNYVPQPLPRYPSLYIHIFGWKFCTPSRYVLCFYHDMIHMMY